MFYIQYSAVCRLRYVQYILSLTLLTVHVHSFGHEGRCEEVAQRLTLEVLSHNERRGQCKHSVCV